MQSIWGKSTSPRVYSDKSVELFKRLITQTRKEFRQEFKHVLEQHPLDSMLYTGSRFIDDDQIYWVLTSKVDEVEFAEAPKRFLFMVLLGACSADYYYRFEKEW